jgi:hypothetical protein
MGMSASLADLQAAVQKTVQLYNRLKSPGAVARVVNVSPALVVVSFSGSFCYDCGSVESHMWTILLKTSKCSSTIWSLSAGRLSRLVLTVLKQATS